MSPRPLDPESADLFEPFVEQAKAGRRAEAIRGVVAAAVASSSHREVKAKAVDALARIARLAEAAGDLEQAEAALRESARLAPGFADVHFRLGCLRLRVHRPAEAQRDLETALRINPRFVGARVELALLDARKGLLGEALATLRGLQGELGSEGARGFDRGLESLEHADWDEAGTRFREALCAGDPSRAIQEYQARREQGDLRGARQVLRSALAANEGYADLHYLLGLTELEEGAFDDAIASFGRALELHPDYHSARVQLARALDSVGDQAQAEEQAALALQADPENPLALELCERWTKLHRRRGAVESASGGGRAKSP